MSGGKAFWQEGPCHGGKVEFLAPSIGNWPGNSKFLREHHD